MKKRLVPVVLLALLLLGAAWWSTRPKYLRYVSPSLKDGTRYTFLYPARVNQVTSSPGLLTMASEPSPSFFDSLWGRLGTARSNTLRSQSERVIYLGEGLKLSAPKVARYSDDLWFPPFSSRYTILYDARSQCFFTLMHSSHMLDRRAFADEAKVVSDSFQILPPGAPVPLP